MIPFKLVYVRTTFATDWHLLRTLPEAHHGDQQLLLRGLNKFKLKGQNSLLGHPHLKDPHSLHPNPLQEGQIQNKFFVTNAEVCFLEVKVMKIAKCLTDQTKVKGNIAILERPAFGILGKNPPQKLQPLGNVSAPQSY